MSCRALAQGLLLAGVTVAGFGCGDASMPPGRYELTATARNTNCKIPPVAVPVDRYGTFSCPYEPRQIVEPEQVERCAVPRLEEPLVIDMERSRDLYYGVVVSHDFVLDGAGQDGYAQFSGESYGGPLVGHAVWDVSLAYQDGAVSGYADVWVEEVVDHCQATLDLQGQLTSPY